MNYILKKFHNIGVWCCVSFFCLLRLGTAKSEVSNKPTSEGCFICASDEVFYHKHKNQSIKVSGSFKQVRVNQCTHFPPNINDIPLSATPPPCWLYVSGGKRNVLQTLEASGLNAIKLFSSLSVSVQMNKLECLFLQ